MHLWDSAAPSLHELETLSTDTLFLDANCAADLDPAVIPSVVAEDACDSDVAVAISHTDDPAVYEAQSDGAKASSCDHVRLLFAFLRPCVRPFAHCSPPAFFDRFLKSYENFGSAAFWFGGLHDDDKALRRIE